MTIVDTECGPVEYAECGSGPPILYFHGTGITCEGMLPFETTLVDSNFRVIMPNRPGYGRTPLPDHRTASACSSVAAALLDTLNIDTAYVMGSSGGAAFATSFAVNYPTRTKCLVLLCPQLHRWSNKSWLPAQSGWTLPFLKIALFRKLLLKMYAIQFRRMTVDQFMKLEAGSRYDSVRNDPFVQDLCGESLKAMASGPSHAGFENDCIVFTTEDIITDGQQLNAPTLLLYDRNDPMAPVAHADWFASIVPNCKCVELHTAGHLIWAGPDAKLMHDSRVEFMAQYAEDAA